MAKLIRSIPCLNVIIDKETNNATYIHVVEVLSLQEGESFLPIIIGTLWQRTKKRDNLDMRVRIFPPSGDPHEGKGIRVEFGEYERYRINLRLPRFPVGESGDYRIVIEHMGRKGWVKDDEFILPVTIGSGPSD